jgi:hypothetical protein
MKPTHERTSPEAGRLEARKWLLHQLGWERTLQLMRIHAAEVNAGTGTTINMQNRVPADREAAYGPVRQRRAS